MFIKGRLVVILRQEKDFLIYIMASTFIRYSVKRLESQLILKVYGSKKAKGSKQDKPHIYLHVKIEDSNNH